ncbi:hypothetical protein ISR4_1187 [Streptococcus pyogenes]|nr:hypothetical protein FE90_1481 [Streptococcus pyogenes]SDV81666.1 hypothetical protein ISR3_0314 [Streptococcus pyogenes]SDV89363.1 hypothetical protein ISR4_1187 [Streptococcus pyogenes]
MTILTQFLSSFNMQGHFSLLGAVFGNFYFFRMTAFIFTG